MHYKTIPVLTCRIKLNAGTPEDFAIGISWKNAA
jgi:hypothetical protein